MGFFEIHPPPRIFFGVLCRAKKRKKYTCIFALKTEKIGPQNSIDATLKPDFNLQNLEKPRKTPKGHKKTQKVVVDFLGFLW